MTFEEYAQAMNKHADECATCDAGRRMSDTRGCCPIGLAMVEEWKNSPHSLADMEIAVMNAVEQGYLDPYMTEFTDDEEEDAN